MESKSLNSRIFAPALPPSFPFPPFFSTSVNLSYLSVSLFYLAFFPDAITPRISIKPSCFHAPLCVSELLRIVLDSIALRNAQRMHRKDADVSRGMA